MNFENDFGPLAAIASLVGLGCLAVLLYIDAIISPADTGLIYTTVTGRISTQWGATAMRRASWPRRRRAASRS